MEQEQKFKNLHPGSGRKQPFQHVYNILTIVYKKFTIIVPAIRGGDKRNLLPEADDFQVPGGNRVDASPSKRRRKIGALRAFPVVDNYPFRPRI